MKYDAFISYRHGELDGFVAEKLHKMLETYRIPGVIAKKIGKKKLSRIFRDREELPTSSNLSDSINDALENSSFLLLICSKRTCQSLWVMREVERFGELHGKDKIITLLIDGEPDESFPPGLREREVNGETIFVEPLAADIRAETWKGSIKLLKEEKLRLLSPILGCAFDDLRRRHRRRRIQRVTAIVGAAFAFVCAFGAFSTYQYLRIDREMQLKLENQSHVLAEYSAGLLADGDPDTAKLLALAALPDDLLRPNRPIVSTAEKALAEALGVYDVSDGFRPHRSLILPAPAGKLLMSPGERYTAVLYPYELAIFDNESGDNIVSLPTIHSTLAEMEFLQDEILVFAGEAGIKAYDISRGETLWVGKPASSIAVSGDGMVIAAVYKDDRTAVLYKSDGHELGSIGFSGKSMLIPVDDSFTHTNNTLFSLNNDGSKLAVSFSDGSLWLYDTTSGNASEIYNANGAIHFNGGFYGSLLVYSLVERGPYNSVLAVYDTSINREIQQFVSDASSFTPYIGTDGIFFAHEQRIYSLDHITGDIELVATVNGRISSFAHFGNTFMIGENDGTYQFSFDRGDARIFSSGHIIHLPVIGSKYALTGSHDSTTIRILKRYDLSYTEILAYDREYRFSEVKINPQSNRAVFYSYRGMRIVDLGGNIIAEVVFDEPETVIDTVYDRESGNVAVLYESIHKIYSGLDGSLLQTAQGKPDWYNAFDFIPDDHPYAADIIGKAEVFFSGGYTFISPLNGDARAYTSDGKLVRKFTEIGYFCEAGMLGEFITADYISATEGRFTLLLKPETLDTVAVLPRFLGEIPDSDNIMLVLDDGRGSLRAVPLLDTKALMDMARERLGDRTLTPEEITRFRAG